MDQHEAERFRASAKKWRQAAAVATDDRERKSCLQLAAGYERLVEIWSGSQIASTGHQPDWRSKGSAPFG